VVERNFIRGVTAPDPEIGYGIQFKLNSTGVVADNVVLDTKGPGIMIYGASEDGRTSTVERNVIAGSRRSSGIVVGGGPAVVRNNVIVSNAEAGVDLHDYRQRGLLRGVVVAHNTIYQAGRLGIALSSNGSRGATIAFNAVRVEPGGAALPGARPGLQLIGNVDCARAHCFSNPEAWNFSPADGSPLRGRVPPEAVADAPRDDFLGHRRGPHPTAGALEAPAGPIQTAPPR
jgi:hypothetical protein